MSDLAGQQQVPGSQPPEPQHNEDFSVRFPGHPAEYTSGILPPVPLEAVYPPMGYPGYEWMAQGNMTMDKPWQNAFFQPANPNPNYTICMPWTAYPYGIPGKTMEAHEYVRAATMTKPLKQYAIRHNLQTGSMARIDGSQTPSDTGFIQLGEHGQPLGPQGQPMYEQQPPQNHNQVEAAGGPYGQPDPNY
eukprot:Selendium_serpulae@DN2367_c1_g1_i1.p1